MAKRYHICYLEPLLACILTCIHTALARASKIKGLDHVRSTFLQYCGTRLKDSEVKLHNSILLLQCYSERDKNLHEASPYWHPDVNRKFFPIKAPIFESYHFCERVCRSHVLKRVFGKKLLLMSSSCRNTPGNEVSER